MGAHSPSMAASRDPRRRCIVLAALLLAGCRPSLTFPAASPSSGRHRGRRRRRASSPPSSLDHGDRGDRDGGRSPPTTIDVVDRHPSPTAGLGMYVHIPYCRRRCNYCDFAIVPVGEGRAGGGTPAEAEAAGAGAGVGSSTSTAATGRRCWTRSRPWGGGGY